MVVADFFEGSGVTAKVANDLGQRLIHADVGVNSIQTARDRLPAAGASFTVYDVQDGASLFRNPIQTMDKLKSLILGLRNEDALDKFWEGAITDSRLGQIPVYNQQNGFVTHNGTKTKTLWDGTIPFTYSPKRLKVRSIAGDETIITLNENS